MANDLKLLYSLLHIYQLYYAAISLCNTPITFHGTIKRARIFHIIELMGILKCLQNLSAILKFLRSLFTAVCIFAIYMNHAQTVSLQELTNCTSVRYHFKCLSF